MFSPPLCWAALRLTLRAQRLWEPQPAQVLWRTQGSSPTLAPERMGELLKGEGDTHQEPELPALRLTFPPALAVERGGSGLNRRFSLWLIAQGQMRFLQDRQRHVILGCFYNDNPTPPNPQALASKERFSGGQSSMAILSSDAWLQHRLPSSVVDVSVTVGGSPMPSSIMFWAAQYKDAQADTRAPEVNITQILIAINISK